MSPLRALAVACCTLAFLAGCTAHAPYGQASLRLAAVDGGVSLRLLPPSWAGRGLLAVDGRLTRADVDHVDVELSLAGTPQATRSVPEERLDEPVTFEHLRAQTSYRVTVRAYRTAGTSQPISVDASSSIDVTTGTDDAAFATPAVATLQVQLADRKPLVAEWIMGADVHRVVAADANTLYVLSGGDVAKVAVDAQANGTVTVLASLPNPTGLALDGSGTTLYYADRTNREIGRITLADGVRTPLDSYFAPDVPYGLTYEPATQTLLVANAGNQVIQRFNPTTLALTTVLGAAGSFLHQSVDDALASAKFNSPAQTAVGPDGTIYVAERPSFGLQALRQADASFVRTRLTDDGQGPKDGDEATARIYGDVRDLAVDPYGQLWFVDDQGGVRRLDRRGTVSALSAIQENGQTTSFTDAQAIAFAPDGTLFVGTPTGAYRVK